MVVKSSSLRIFMNAVSVAELEISVVAMKAMEENAKEESAESHVGLTCAAASSGESRVVNDTGNVMNTVG